MDDLFKNGIGVAPKVLVSADFSMGEARAKILTEQYLEAYPELKKLCHHDFKEYQGITEHYRYCTKCDHKQDVSK